MVFRTMAANLTVSYSIRREKPQELSAQKVEGNEAKEKNTREDGRISLNPDERGNVGEKKR